MRGGAGAAYGAKEEVLHCVGDAGCAMSVDNGGTGNDHAVGCSTYSEAGAYAQP